MATKHGGQVLGQPALKGYSCSHARTGSTWLAFQANPEDEEEKGRRKKELLDVFIVVTSTCFTSKSD